MTPADGWFSFILDAPAPASAEEKTLDDHPTHPRPTGAERRRVPWYALTPEARSAIRRRSWNRAVILFLATVLSTLYVGSGMNTDASGGPGSLLDGWVFALPLLGILLCHEFGHYLLARRHEVEVSPPYFIPFPNLLGTMGAFIAFRSPIYNRRQLLDIGAAGPLAGLVPSIIALIVGFALSRTLPETTATGGLILGDSLLTAGLQRLVIGPIPDGYTVYIHPVGFAGWVGLFVTMWNLLPIWQFDGGHIAYALFGRRQWLLGPLAIAGLLLLGWLVARWWWYVLVFLAILFFVYVLIARLSAGVRIPLTDLVTLRFLRHFPVANEEPLDRNRRIIGWICLIVFALCFIPDPIRAIGA